MPEGPEVYSFGILVVNSLYKTELKQIKINSGKYRRKPFYGYDKIKHILPSKILSIGTYGKLLLIELESDYYIVIGFGMSGYMTTQKIKHNHITFVGSKNNQITKIYFNDHRNFGNIYIMDSQMLASKLENIGPDLLNNKTTFEIFIYQYKQFVNKYPQMEIGLLLLDQRFVCGIGNYLRADILYLSKINPWRKLNSLKKSEILNLYNKAYNLIRYYATQQVQNLLNTEFDDLDLDLDTIKYNLRYRLKITPDKYDRIFLIYNQKYDIYKNPVQKDKLYDRTMHWVSSIQK